MENKTTALVGTAAADLTHDAILAMSAGRTIEEMIAVHLFGFADPYKLRTDDARPWVRVWGKCDPAAGKLAMRFNGRANVDGTWGIYDGLLMPAPCSKDMPYAWLLWQYCLTKYGPDSWAAALAPTVSLRDCQYRTISTLAIVVKHLTPLAICKAALLVNLNSMAAGAPTKEGRASHE